MVKVIKMSVILKYKAGQPSDQTQPPRAFPDCAGGDQVFRQRDCSSMTLHKIHPASSSRWMNNTVCFIRFGHRNEAIVSLIWNFWGFKGVLCDPKTGRKLLLGQKHTEISFAVSQEEDFKKEELQDLVLWGGFPGYLRNVLLDPVQIFFLKSLQLVIFFNAFIITTFKTKI